MKDKTYPLAEEQFDYSYHKAMEIIGELFRDGSNGLTIQTVFMTGAAMSASMNEMDKANFMKGSEYFFNVYKNYAQDLDKVINKPMLGMKK